MGSLYLNALTAEQRKDLERRLHQTQGGRCFICEKLIDLDLHAGAIDIDHVEPIKVGGRDDPINFALTHASCNRSKQASDLRVARVLARFASIRDKVGPLERGPNLNDILACYREAPHQLPLRVEGTRVLISFPATGDNAVTEANLYFDELSGMKYFFAMIPIQYLNHDDRINPRAIGSSLNGLIEEFHKKRPQLHVALGWTELSDSSSKTTICVFDGQHKVAAQVLLGVRRIPIRIFLNPNLDLLLTANTNAGTTLRQVAFDKSVQRHLGNTLFLDRIERFRRERCLASDNDNFSERDLVNHFKGEWREMRRYIIDSVRNSITHDPTNKLRDFVDYGGKAKDLPISYSTIEKTFYSFFIYGGVLDTPLNYRLDENENPRQLERDQIVRLMNIIAQHIFVGQFDPVIGTSRIEHSLQRGEDIPDGHVRAFRLSKEEILYSWLRLVRQIVQNYFIMQGFPIQENKLFQYRFPEPLWENIDNFIISLSKMPIWVNRDLSLSVFGGKQNYEYWQKIFESGMTPQGQQVLPARIDLMKMIQA